MKVLYANRKVEEYCTSVKAASKLFGGDKELVRRLFDRVYEFQHAETIIDIIKMPTFRFHALHGKREGTFAVDLKTRRQKWRIILIPLNDEEAPFEPCYIDQIAPYVRIIEIEEVSKHYE